METNQIHLWVAYPDDLKGEATALTCAQLLNEDERTRLKRFKFDRHRREQLATRVLQRSTLSAYAQIAPEAWRFEAGKHGKPSIDSASGGQEPGLNFNLSNSLGLVVCAVTRGPEIGVDVEPFSRASTIDEVAERFFSARELEQLEPLRGERRRERALTLWTLKEAYMKARGLGMALPTKLFSFVFEGAAEGDIGITLEIDPKAGDEPERWQFCTLDHAQHRIALMVESNSAPQIEVWEAHPILATPKRLPVGEIKWHPGSAETRKIG
jgi:4'-phosphopantetheinyl transferase